MYVNLVAYAIEKSELFLKSLAEIYDFADYWDKYGRVVFREERKPKRVFRKKK